MSKFGGKSEVWKHFKLVVGSDNICVGFVSCIKCGTLLAYDSVFCVHHCSLFIFLFLFFTFLHSEFQIHLRFIQLFLNKQTTQFTCFFLVVLFIKIIIKKCTHNYELDKCYRYVTMHKQMPFNLHVQNSELNECAAICTKRVCSSICVLAIK